MNSQLPSADTFSFFLGNVAPENFFAEHWERRSLHLRHGQAGRFSHLISHDSFFEREISRCYGLKASRRGSDGWNQEIQIRPEQAHKLFRAGMTICASMLDETGPCGEVIAALRNSVTTAVPPHVNCYYSPHGEGYGLHFDTHPVFILQVAGSKHWTVSYEPAVKDPPFNVLFPPGRDRVRLPWISLDRPDTEDPERFLQVLLEPGDVLYMPAGCWHAARAEGVSMALTLALGRITSIDLFLLLAAQLARQHLGNAVTRLAPFPKPSVTGDGAARREALAQLDADLEHLRHVVGRIDAESLLQSFEFHAEHPEHMLANRQMATAQDQVGAMKARKGGQPPRAAAPDGAPVATG